MTVGLDMIHIVDPQAIERARRLEFAVRQIAAGVHRRHVVTMIRAKFDCSYWTAWRCVDMANDLAGPIK